MARLFSVLILALAKACPAGMVPRPSPHQPAAFRMTTPWDIFRRLGFMRPIVLLAPLAEVETGYCFAVYFSSNI